MTAPLAAPQGRSLPHPLVSVLIVFVVVAFIVGCAGPGAERATSRPVAFAGDLAGTCQGSFWWLGGYYHEDAGTVLLQIKEDGTFTVAMRPTGAANNIAKASSWSGTVSQSGARVVFHVAKGSWPAWSSLARSGDRLYGVANDPATGADIEVKLERTGASLGTGAGGARPEAEALGR